MSSNPLDRAAVVPDTEPAQIPGPEVTGQHVKLELLTREHFPGLRENITAHADLWTWWPDEPPKNTVSESDGYFTHLLEFRKPDLMTYAVLPLSGPSKGKAAGIAFALSEDRDSARVGELGVFFGPPLHRNRAGTEVAYLICNLLFTLNHRRIGWETNSLNLQSRKAAERYGFVYEGTLRQNKINKGRNRDTSWYSIIDSEWPVCRKAFEIWLEDANFDEDQQQKRKIEQIRDDLKWGRT